MRKLTYGVGGVVLSILSIASLAKGDDGLAWSNTDTEKTPQGNVTFHGPFSNETVSVSTDHLPQHEFLDITFDFLALRSWDGSVDVGSDNRPSRLGPDVVRVNLKDGPMLLYTTFSNRPDDPGFQEASKFQNYPSPVAGDHLRRNRGRRRRIRWGTTIPGRAHRRRFRWMRRITSI